MSRVGKKPVAIPKGVTAKVDGQKVSIKGAKGELHFTVPDEVSVSFANDEVVGQASVTRPNGRRPCGAPRARR